MAIGAGLSVIRAAPTRDDLENLDLVAVLAFDYVPDVHGTVHAGVGALEACVMRLYCIIVLLGRWVRVVR